jgi:hypothetical protein
MVFNGNKSVKLPVFDPLIGGPPRPFPWQIAHQVDPPQTENTPRSWG